VWAGGRFAGSEGERLRLLSQAVRLGAEFVDVEWRADWGRVPRLPGTRLVLSDHDFSGVPRDLAERVRTMRAAAATIKVAVTATCAADCLTLRDAARGGGDQVMLAMGPAGVITRCCPWLWGSRWTYGGSAAPGQTTVSDLVRLYRVRQTSASTAVFALTGRPLAHSASPAMQNAALAEARLDAVYVPMEAASGADFLAVADALGLTGASVTAPLKQGWEKLGVVTDATASAVGAVNTLRRNTRGWEGRNFDVEGFLAPLDAREVPLEGRRAVILGAGGAARAAAWALKTRRARVEVSARQDAAAVALAADLGVASVQWPPSPGWDLLVNATPVGMTPAADASPLATGAVVGGAVYDLVYNPRETALLRQARDAGAVTISGLDMLVHQAALQFLWWTGMDAPVDTMRQAAVAFLDRNR
jgi:3-dehydroquinate dehydratase/shikimate dehydrogenase